MKKITKKILLFFALIMFVLLLMSNTSNAAETLQYDNFNYHIESTESYDSELGEYVTINIVEIDSLVDNTVTEARIPATINGMKVTGFSASEYVEEGVYKHFLTTAPNLKKLIIEDASIYVRIYHDFKNTTIEEIVFEEMVFDYPCTLPSIIQYLSALKTVYGYGHTRLQDKVEDAGYEYISLGENTSPIIYNDANTKLMYLNAYVDDLVIPENISNIQFIIRNSSNSSYSEEDFSCEATQNIKSIKFETKDQIKLIDQGKLSNVEKVYGYEGTGAETVAENIGAEFISLGKTDKEVSLYDYEIIDDSYVKINGFNRIYPFKVEFPEYIEGLPVKIIGGVVPQVAWATWAELDEVVIPATVETVVESAFTGAYLKKMTVLSKKIDYKDDFCGMWKGYSITSPTEVYAYDESGMKEVVIKYLGEIRYHSLNEVEYTTKDTEDVTVDESTVTVMPVVKGTSTDGLLTEENFPVIGTYTVKVLDANGNEKSSAEKVGSKNIVQITDDSGNVLVEYTVVVPGDINGDGEVRIYDSFQILKDVLISLGEKIDAIEVMIRDFNDDGEIRIYDAFQYLKEAILG